MNRLYCSILYPIYFLFFISLVGCATYETRTRHEKTVPQYFEVKESKLLVQKISYGGKDAELVITELGVYVLYGKDDAYFNPSYECPYNNFGHEVIEKGDLIGINCKEGTDNKIHYFHVPNASNRSSAISTIKMQSTKATVQSHASTAGKLVTSHESIIPIGISLPDTCIPSEALEKIDQDGGEALEIIDQDGGELHPIMLLHPEIAGHIILNPAALVAVGLGLALEKAFPYKPKEPEGAEFLTTHTSLVGESTDFSIVLAETAKTRFASSVGLISRPCDASANNQIEKKAEIKNNFGTIIRVDSLSGKLLGYDTSASENYDTELWLFCFYSVLNAVDGDVINTGTVQYVNSDPLKIPDESKINDEVLQAALQSAYKDMAGLLIDNLVTN
jgi:hypothetical protein